MMPIASRSLTEPPGLKYSTFDVHGHVLRREAVDSHDRGPADRLEDVVVDAMGDVRAGTGEAGECRPAAGNRVRPDGPWPITIGSESGRGRGRRLGGRFGHERLPPRVAVGRPQGQAAEPVPAAGRRHAGRRRGRRRDLWPARAGPGQRDPAVYRPVGLGARPLAPRRPLAWLVGVDDRPGQGARHRPLLRDLGQLARQLLRLDRAGVTEPGHRLRLRRRLPRSCASRTSPAPARPRSTPSASSGSRRSSVPRSAA